MNRASSLQLANDLFTSRRGKRVVLTGILLSLTEEVDYLWAVGRTRYFEISKISVRDWRTKLPVFN